MVFPNRWHLSRTIESSESFLIVASGMLLTSNYVSRSINQPACRHALITVNGILFLSASDDPQLISFVSLRIFLIVVPTWLMTPPIIHGDRTEFPPTCLLPVCPGERKRDNVVVHVADGGQATARRTQQPTEQLSRHQQAAKEHRCGEHISQKMHGHD